MGLEPTQWCLTGTCSATELPTQMKSALRESNPPVQLGRLAPLPLGQGHVYSPSSGSRGTRTHNGHFARTCFRGRLLIRPDDFHSYPAAVAGIEPASRRLTVAFPYQHRTHRIEHQSAWSGFEPTISCTQGTRISFPHASAFIALSKERPVGFEPTQLPWQSSTLPLHHGR